MTNPFKNRAPSLAGPATDIRPVAPDDSNDLPVMALALYVETGGAIRLISATGDERQVAVANFSLLPVGTMRVLETGTTASGIHALTVA